MAYSYTREDLEALLENDYEVDEAEPEAEFPETPFRPMRSAPAKSSYQPRPTTQYVTQTQLQATTTRIDGRITTLSKETTQHVNTLKREQSKQVALLKKEVADRKKETQSLKKDLSQLRDMAAILPLISRPSSQALTADVDGLTAGTKVMIDKGDTLSLLLPLLLLGGIGGSGGGSLFGGGSEGGGDSSGLLMLVLLLGMTNR